MNNKTKILLFGFGLYFLSTGLSFAAFSKTDSISSMISPVGDQKTKEDELSQEQIFFTGPRDQECPINGKKYTKEQLAIWEKKRPLMVMVENHENSRPQSGLSRADVVYESVAEGGITRFLGVYYCEATEPYSGKYDLGPVRSARTYFLDWASEYSDYPLYVHVGGAHCSSNGSYCTTDKRAQALEQIGQYGWLDPDHRSDMNQFALSYRECRREPERTGESRATEHTMYCDSNALWAKAESRDLAAKNKSGDSWDEDFRQWKFKDEAASVKRGTVSKIEFDFWESYSDYHVKWDYDREKNLYFRSNGDQDQKDFINNQPLSAKTVVIQFTKEIGPVDEHKHMLYTTIGQGKALIFRDGEAIEGKWSKETRKERTVFTDSKGKEVEFNRGRIWIEILSNTNEVDYNEAG
ncbi:MAG: DUF3048 domain-containing protein [Patescibacteria group bacterium]|nr:DUF3048 domain-containing protein [Patescibacteria group bacterium]